MAGFIDEIRQNPNISRILKSIRNIGAFGMTYDDMVIKNSQAIGATETALMQSGSGVPSSNDEEFVYALAAQDTSNKKYIAYFDKDLKFQMEFLRKFAMNSEIEYILDTIADEAIVYDNKNFFAHLSLINLELKDEVIKKLRENFRKLYVLHGFNNGLTGWQYFKSLLVDGFLSFEIIYSNDGKNIVGFKELDPLSLTPGTEKQQDGSFKPMWHQYYGDMVRYRRLYDPQVIYISYAKGNTITRTSYIHRLVRSYNVLRIMEQTRIIWNVMNASYRIKMTIPVGTKSPQKAKQTLGELMSIYKEDFKINTDTGELSINGKPNVQFYKNYLFPQQGGEAPKVETMIPQGPNLNVIDSLIYFSNKLKQDSKIPYSRFAARSGTTPGQFKIAAEAAERDEVRFSKFITRLRSIFQEIIIKPLWIQMCLDFPELKEDLVFKSQLGIKFESDNVFGESREIEQMIKKVDFIAALSEIKEKVDDQEVPFFDQDFLIDKYLEINNEDRHTNQLYIEADKKRGESSASGSESTPSAGTPEKEESTPSAETPAEESTPAATPEFKL